MATETHCCVFTRGEFFIRDAALNCGDGGSDLVCAQGPFVKLGGLSSGMIEIQGNVLGRENEFNPACPESRLNVSNVTLSLTLQCASKRNLIQALIAGADANDAGTFIQDFCFNTLNDEMFFPFEHKGLVADTVTVYLKDSLGEVISTLVEGTDYLVSSSGIQIMNNSIDITDAVTLRITYEYDNVNSIGMEFFNGAPKYKEVYFKGTNYGDGTETLFDAVIYRVLFAPLSQFDLISQGDFFTIQLVGSVEKTDGKWFKITKEE